MSRLLAALIAVCVCAAGCSRPGSDVRDRSAAEPAAGEGVARTAGETPAASRPRVVFLGDSLTAGYGLAREQSVPSLIQKRLDEAGYNYEVVNHGVSGDTSAGGVSRLEWALDGDVRVMVLELGANDGLRGVPVESMKANLATIIKGAKARGVRVLLTGMEAPPSHGPAYTVQFRQAFRDLAREHDVAFVPFYLEGVAGIPELNISDGIHPNAEGAVIVERTIWRALEPLLEQVRTRADTAGSGTR
ncbi:MAG TPA: arylesterase [Vicinamibacterales bacterium]|nr:arylesterase [Vicinamibacterales bacterium]